MVLIASEAKTAFWAIEESLIGLSSADLLSLLLCVSASVIWPNLDSSRVSSIDYDLDNESAASSKEILDDSENLNIFDILRFRRRIPCIRLAVLKNVFVKNILKLNGLKEHR